MSADPLIEISKVSVHYSGVRALEDVSISLLNNEIVALMGPNGAGKSTVLKSIFGLVDADRGEIRYMGKSIMPIPHRMVAAGIAFVPQGRRVFANLTVQENLEVGGFIVNDSEELARRIDTVTDAFPVLKAKRRVKAGLLSGGQQQMVALARSLVVNPKVLLLDEPSLGLAPKIVKEVFAMIADINRNYGTAILVVEHNIKSILEIVHRCYVMDKGKIVAEGEAEKLIKSEILKKVFLGELE